MDRTANALLLGVIGATALVAVAGAACNEVPGAEMLSLPGADTPFADFGFKGALGRIDRVYMVSTEASRTPASPKAPAMTVVADGVCVGADGRGVKVPP